MRLTLEVYPNPSIGSTTPRYVGLFIFRSDDRSTDVPVGGSSITMYDSESNTWVKREYNDREEIARATIGWGWSNFVTSDDLLTHCVTKDNTVKIDAFIRVPRLAKYELVSS